MFDFRYHVASLAAVFFALVIGILVGVALASHGLGNTERKRLEEDLRRAENQADVLRTQVATLMNDGAGDRAFVEGTYKSVMANKLAKKPLLASYSAPDQLKNLGHDLGQEFVVGTDTLLWTALQSLIVEEKAGPSRPPADGVVIVRTTTPQTGPTALFLTGLYAGLADVGVPVIGVERTNDPGSAIKAFQRSGFSTVDDIDTRIGKLALVALLADPSSTGAFGSKKTAQAQLPPISPLPAAAGG